MNKIMVILTYFSYVQQFLNDQFFTKEVSGHFNYKLTLWKNKRTSWGWSCPKLRFGYELKSLGSQLEI